MNFLEAFDQLMLFEGGYTTGTFDPGKETNYGISKRSYPGEDIKNLSLDRAKQIYLHDFWGPSGCDAIPGPLRYPLFDYSVNSGVSHAVKSLQSVISVQQDGIIGPRTLGVISTFPIGRLIVGLFAERIRFMSTLVNWPHAGRSWANRVGILLQFSLKDIS